MHCTCPEGQHVPAWGRSWSYSCPLDTVIGRRIKDDRPPLVVRYSQWVSAR